MSKWAKRGGMDSYYIFVKKFLGIEETFTNKKYCNIGHSFYVDNEYVEGTYWFHETSDFIIDIHDFYIKKEMIRTDCSNMKNFVSFFSSYIIRANGENFNPYQTLSANSLYVLDIENAKSNYRFLLHSNSPYCAVGINFKKHMVKDFLSSISKTEDISCLDVFLNTKTITTKSLEPIARDILNCKMISPAAELFFEAKAKEWISIVINAFLNKENLEISIDDNNALEDVANYLNDHYSLNVSQNTLEKIAMMSGTKLKKLFKAKYQSTITEYTQKKRMNVAENLLLNSSLKIQDIAKAVGYSSHSKFTNYFKKYRGVYPSEIKKYAHNKTKNENN